jgi:hypothetical protein
MLERRALVALWRTQGFRTRIARIEANAIEPHGDFSSPNEGSLVGERRLNASGWIRLTFARFASQLLSKHARHRDPNNVCLTPAAAKRVDVRPERLEPGHRRIAEVGQAEDVLDAAEQ